MKTDTHKTSFLVELTSEEKQKRTYFISTLPYPLGYLYRELILRVEMGEYCSFYDITELSTALLRYLTSIAVADYVGKFEKGDLNCSEINQQILGYLRSPSNSKSRSLLKSILEFYIRENVKLEVEPLKKLLKAGEDSRKLPEFFDARGKLIDVFLYFCRLEEELDRESFKFSEPSVKTFASYLDLFEYLVEQLEPVLQIDLKVPVTGFEYNTLDARGVSLEPANTNYENGEEVVKEFDRQPTLYLDPTKSFSLYPFVCLEKDNLEEPRQRGSLLFVYQASLSGVTFTDFVSRRQVVGSQLNEKLINRLEEIVRDLQAEAPREQKPPTSPIINFDDFINFHDQFYLDRSALRKEVEGFIYGNNRHYGLITAQIGKGKTAFLANLVKEKKDHPVVYHFIRDVNSLDDPVIILRSLIGQLMKIGGVYEKSSAEIPGELKALEEKFLTVLERTAADCKKNNERLLLIIDGIDVAREPEKVVELLPDSLPDNVVGIISARIDEQDSEPLIDLSGLGARVIKFKNCPLKGFDVDEIPLFLQKVGFVVEDKTLPQKLLEKIYYSTFGGDPLMMQLLIEAVRLEQIKFKELIRLDEKPSDWSLQRWKEHLLTDEYFRCEVLLPLYSPARIPDDPNRYFSDKILGLFTALDHSVTDEDLAQLLRAELYRVKQYRRLLNKFLMAQDDNYSIRHHSLREVFSHLYTTRDYLRYRRMIINFYEVTRRVEGVARRDCKSLSRNALRFLPEQYFKVGEITGDYQGLWDLESDENFRWEQGLKIGVRSILRGLENAIDAAIKKDNINEFMKFSFLYNDVESGGIRGGLSTIVTQALEGNYNEAMNLIRKIPDEAFQYKQMLFLAWLLARSNDFMNCMEILDEALLLPGATFEENDEDLIFKIVENIIEIGIAEGLDILKTGIEEERIVRYYSRLADLLKDYPALILNLATGASMQLRKTRNEEVKGRFIVEFAGIIIKLDDEIKRRQFFENFVFEAKNLEDETIKYRTLADLGEIAVKDNPERAEDLLREILDELKDMGPHSPLRYKLEAVVAGKAARMEKEEWAAEIFNDIIQNASNLPVLSERAEVYEEIAAATVNLENPVIRAEFLEKIFSLAENLDTTSQQARVMVGISEVLGTSDEDAELLNIYMETFSYIDELPVDTAADAAQRVAANMKVVREQDDYRRIITSINDLVSDLDTGEEISPVLKSAAKGLTESKHLDQQNSYNFIGQIINMTDKISAERDQLVRGETLGCIARFVLTNRLDNKVNLVRLILQKTENIEDEQARAAVYREIGQNLYNLEDPADLELVYSNVEAEIVEIKNPGPKAEALIGMVRGITSIEGKALREKFVEKLLYVAENLEDGNQAYRVLSSITGGLLKHDEEKWAIELYEKALSRIPLKEEKAPQALGGVMAGLSRGLANFAREEWAREIYDKLVNRLDFIAPEKKKLEVLNGIVDGMSELEDRQILKEYYNKLVETSDNFINRREKVLAFLKLADAYLDIAEKDLSRKMWERVISISTALDDKETGQLKAETLAQSTISIWQFEDQQWMEQAFEMIVRGVEQLPPDLLASYLEQLFKHLDKIQFADFQDKVIETSMNMIENLDDPEDRVYCVQAISRGIIQLPESPLLKKILNRSVKVIEGIKKGTYRVQAMAVISSNFLNIGMTDWAKKAFEKIEKAYEGLRDNKIRSILLAEMVKIPFASGETDWQDSIVFKVFNREIKDYKGKNRARILKSLARAIPRAGRAGWQDHHLDRIVELARKLPRDSTYPIYESMFEGLAEGGFIDTILRYRKATPSRSVTELGSKYLVKALKKKVQQDVKRTFSYYRQIESGQIKLDLLRELFGSLLENRQEFTEDEFMEFYREFLKLSIYKRDALDFVVGKIVSYYRDEEKLKQAADFLGLVEKVVPKPEVKPKAVPEVVPEIAVPAPPPIPAPVPIPEEERILPAEKEEVEVEAPMELQAEPEVEEIQPTPEPVKSTGAEEKKEQVETAAPTKRGLLHRWSGEPVRPKTVPPPTGEPIKEGELSDFLKDGYKLVRSHYFREAIRYFEHAVEHYPEDPRGLIGLAAIYYRLQDYKKAAEYYIAAKTVKPGTDIMDRFIKGIPKNVYIWYDFAKNLYELGDLDETIKFCDRIKSEGVYFDFAKRVDNLKEMAMETELKEEESPLVSYYKPAIIAGAIVVALFLLTQFASWFNFIVGNIYMNSGYKRVEILQAGRYPRSKDFFIPYSQPFRTAIKSYDRVRQTIFFPGGMYEDVVLNRARCRYEIAHYLRVWKFIPHGSPPRSKQIQECVEQRQKALEELDDLIKKNNYKAMYYAGLCHLDNALGSSSVLRRITSSRIEEFDQAVHLLRESINYSSRQAGLEHYLMLGIARLEYYISYPGIQASLLLDQGLENLKKAERMGRDPRIEVYKIAAYNLMERKAKAKKAREIAKRMVMDDYQKYPEIKKYWQKKIAEFSVMED